MCLLVKMIISNKIEHYQSMLFNINVLAEFIYLFTSVDYVFIKSYASKLNVNLNFVDCKNNAYSNAYFI